MLMGLRPAMGNWSARLVLPVFFCMLILGIGSPALAESDMEEVTVIGQELGSLRLNEVNSAGGRLGLSGFETPASVDLITQAELVARGDDGVLAAITRTSGISATASPGNGGTSISSRGFSGHNSSLVTYDGTRLYITAGTVTFPADTGTLDRIEVLRGAGSVINGIGALGTTINYIPKAPVLGQSHFDVQIGLGSFGKTRLGIGGGATISDHWAFQLDLIHNEEDGYVDRADSLRNVLAGSLLFKPSSDFSMKLSIDYAEIEDAPYWGTPLINGKASSSHREQNYNYGDGSVEYEDLWTRLKTEWQLTPNIAFRHDIYYLDVEREWQNLEEYAYNGASDRIDRAFYLGIIHDQQQLGTRGDFLIESNWGLMSNKLTLGAEVNSIDLKYYDNFATGGFGVSDSVTVDGFDPGRVPSATIPTILDYKTETKQIAFFVDDVWRITEQVSLVLGGRYDQIDFDRFDYAIGASPSAAFDTDFSEFTWRAGLVYQLSPLMNLYAQASQAVDPVTSPVTISASRKDFDLSQGRQYEVGIKQQFLGGRAEYTIAYFDITKKDLLTRRPASAVTEQIGQQSSDGVELTFRINPTESLILDVNAAWVDAQFDEFYSGGVSLSGNTPRNVPEKTANLWLTWSPTSRFKWGGGLRYVDSRYGNDANTQELPSYTVVDSSLSWKINEHAIVMLYARNLTDEDNYVLSQYTPDQWIFGKPRSYEVTARFTF
ncbi:MAG: TonB-dependent siderophore receptor [bacterium]|nr:TonB-dependent siderophore receptor [Gammaproteobacteria bacterium]